jgi:hypothetical protein
LWLANDDDSSVLEPAVAVVVMNVAGEVRNENMITVDTHTHTHASARRHDWRCTIFIAFLLLFLLIYEIYIHRLGALHHPRHDARATRDTHIDFPTNNHDARRGYKPMIGSK